MTIQQINISIIAGQDGGLIIYENVDSENVLAFGGDLDAVTKYLNGRMGKIIASSDAKNDGRPTRLASSTSIIRRLEEIEPAA